MTNPPEKSHAGRLVVFLDRVEDGIPGRVAFGVHRGRTVGRSTAIDGMRLLEAWARRRAERLATVAPQHRDDPQIDLTGDNVPEPSADAHLAAMTRPDESWTKGRIYDLARALDLEGRSKLNKAELLDAVLEELDDRRDLDGPRTPVYSRDPADATV